MFHLDEYLVAYNPPSQFSGNTSRKGFWDEVKELKNLITLIDGEEEPEKETGTMGKLIFEHPHRCSPGRNRRKWRFDI